MPRKKVTPKVIEKVLELKKKDMSYRDIAKEVGISKTTVGEIIRKYEGKEIGNTIMLWKEIEEIKKRLEVLNLMDQIGRTRKDCPYRDELGYCRAIRFSVSPVNLVHVKARDPKTGESFYLINTFKHPAICAFCGYYLLDVHDEHCPVKLKLD